jgi:hypothetical protein
VLCMCLRRRGTLVPVCGQVMSSVVVGRVRAFNKLLCEGRAGCRVHPGEPCWEDGS